MMSDERLSISITKGDVEAVLSKRAIDMIRSMATEDWVFRAIESAMTNEFKKNILKEIQPMLNEQVRLVLLEENVISMMTKKIIRAAVAEHLKSATVKEIIKDRCSSLVEQMSERGGK